jgi:thiol-disulfide isomerase/thioredoxin
MQKGSPPTHLIQSRSGDYLRGRLVKLDDKALEVELRLDSKTVPRDRVGLIIWLHPEEKEAAKPQEPKEAGESLLVQAVCSDGIRLTYRADQFTGNALAGVSDVLGACQVQVKDIDQILIGSGIEQAAAQLAYQQWKLQDAPEIKVAQADANGSAGGQSAGTESPLVGKPAPDFTLELLDGKKFHLAEQKGKIILLDFWATWCGPCLNAMPQVEEVAREFQDRDVQLIAVNLQEDAKQITAMLERHNLHPTVALDRDGVVAERYAANAIPQTVVIDKEGKLVRLFVGGGPHLGDQLRQSLNAVIDPAAAPPASVEKPAAENDRQETGEK